ncbi:MAG TPA: trypsin-like peptidase domain-containing protein [Acidimicrobiales bacterium]|nr:trypsin-like peptidase domain-containing protein [Acidimicrobiales bacterium]
MSATTTNPARTAVDRVGPSVVRVGRHGGRGGGLVIEPGAVVTNAHNLRGAEITVVFADGRQEVGTVAGHDVDGDLAVVRVDTGDAPVAEWGGTADLGEPVHAVSRLADGGVRVTTGAISATGRAFRGPRGRRISGSLEHTAPLARGSSGSPIVDGEGRVVGLNTSRLGEGFYLALPADEVLRDRLRALAAGEVRTPRRLGIGLAPAETARRLRRSVGLPERDGLLVRLVEEGGAGDRAGLREGDLIVAAGGSPVAGVDDLHEAVDAVPAGESLVLQVVRGADELEVRVAFDGDG